jgi:hypothetical protein
MAKTQPALLVIAGFLTCLGTPLAHASTNSADSTVTSMDETKPAKTSVETPLSVWSFCEQATVATEMAQRLPRAVLFSVAMVESGRFNAATRKTRPWPWTINAEGQSYYFKTKRDAIAAAHRLRKEGVRSMDVGCMQINLRYHPDAFTDLDAAFDPIINVAYAAEFLKRLHTRTDSWPEAIAAYHSQSKTRSQPYFARVIDVWTDQHTRISKLAHELREQAKAQVTAQLRHTQTDEIAGAASNTANAPRPAPKVLVTAEADNVHQAAGAGVGLRLSIAESDFADIKQVAYRTAPQVIENTVTAGTDPDTKPANDTRKTVTVLADASPAL